jgi:alkylation response protein AidB-like acyl-CoA dehydrogenase
MICLRAGGAYQGEEGGQKNKDGYVLNGTKTWATPASVADVILVYVSTNPEAKGKGISAFIVDAKTPGITTTNLDKMVLH